ncbi:hypothetical protein [Clostridium formicaceticum]|uniref:Virulence-related protein n=1 Tax=Clostridium formicaceticum TaxID=1497 RepID=A0AAC9WFQ5_9CLOT|nr:hypothetical protein [Clostridium formicaceticum]AOY76726.1 hypothetical protein BJL90_13125 [Clostridium formicaceticum]ARE87162.1 hypothetical protein CLFO_15500 [Clostridium formicaceticum]
MDRKEIVRLLGEYFGVKPQYMGAPSFAFQIEAEEEIYTIDKAGKITTAQGNEVEFEKLINGRIEKEAIEEVDEAAIKQKSEQEPLTEDEIEFIVALPMEGHTGETLRNIVNMIASKQPLISKAFQLEEDIIEESFIIGINEVKIETLEEFRTAIDDIGAECCRGIGFDFHEKKITFNFYQGEEKRDAYIQLVALINQKAKEQKYASAKCKLTDNEKFTFRTWLTRLGMVGYGYKEIRKQLLENMEGNGAFRHGKPEKMENEDVQIHGE